MLEKPNRASMMAPISNAYHYVVVIPPHAHGLGRAAVRPETRWQFAGQPRGAR